MGKEHDILQAAQTGNLAKLEALLTQKSKVFGLFKGPNINWRDDSGCSALHLAALNGEKDVVSFLLHNDASANIPDNAGSFPLHLAAFNGHHEVVSLLITRGPSRASVNEPNLAGDTALHVASQYGHSQVVKVLLEYHADIYLRNSKEETALDLAAQYGRLPTVQLFLLYDRTLLFNAVHKHSPLHLAARNGHEKVVELLLSSGMPVNATCDMGTALHCAALYGKVGVAKLLLQLGIDIEIENDDGEKVLDLLCNHPSQISQEITALIYEETQTRLDKAKVKVFPTSASYSGQKYELVNNTRSVNSNLKQSNEDPNYDILPPPRPALAKRFPDRPYSLIQGPVVNTKDSYLKNSNFETASITPVVNKSKSLVHMEQESQYTGYCLLGDIQPEQSQTNDDEGMYCSLDENIKLNNKKLYLEERNQQDQLSLYSVLPSGKPEHSNKNKNIINEMPSAALNNYDNVNIKNKPISQSLPSMETPIFKENPPCQLDSQETHPVKTKPVKQKRTNLNQNTSVKTNEDVVDIKLQGTKNCILSHLTEVESKVENSLISNMEGNDSSQTDKHSVQSKLTDDKQLTYNSTNNQLNDQQASVYTEYQLPSKPQAKVKQFRTSQGVSTGCRMSALKSEGSLNETYEWNKIDNFLSNLEAYMDMSNITEIPSRKVSTESVSLWLASLHLPQYEQLFIANGFDEIDFLNGCVEDQDLFEIGIIDSNHRKKLIEAIENLPKMLEMGDSNFSIPENVHEWLGRLKLSEYESRFIRYGYESIDRVRVIWDIELLTVLEITSLGHRKRLLKSLGRRNKPINKSTASWAQKFADADSGIKKKIMPIFGETNQTQLKLLNIKELDFVSLGAGEVSHTLKKKAEVCLPGATEGGFPEAIKANPIRASEAALPEAIKVDPSEAFEAGSTGACEFIYSSVNEVDTTGKSESLILPGLKNERKSKLFNPVSSCDKEDKFKSYSEDWLHDPNLLLMGSVSYPTNYLGSHPVQHVKGVKSTLEACSRMKAISRNISKMPLIILSISARGIDYIDSNSKMIISQYDIVHISFCAQDPDDMNVFAYITRDQHTMKSYCHVFRAETEEIAEKIVVTIGQSFKLAYEQHVQMQLLKRAQVQTT